MLLHALGASRNGVSGRSVNIIAFWTVFQLNDFLGLLPAVLLGCWVTCLDGLWVSGIDSSTVFGP